MSATASETEKRPSEAYGWYVVFVLCVCGIMAFVDRQIINLLVDPIRRDLDITDTQISLLQGFAFVVFYATVAIPLGRLADAKNRRILITIGVLVWTAAAFACGLADTYTELFIARVFVGIGEAVLTPAGFSLLADYFRPTRLALPISVFTASSFFGSGIALLGGGYLIGLIGASQTVDLPLLGTHADWQAAFMLAALPGVLVALWFFLTVREPPRRGSATAASSAQSGVGFAAALAYLRSQPRVFLAVYVGLSLLAAAQFSLGAWAPAFFIRVHGWTAAEIGYAYGLIFLFLGTGGVVAGGWIADWLHARGYRDANLRTAMFAGLAALPFAVSFAQVDDPRLAIALMAPIVAFGVMPFGAGSAVIPIVSPPRFRAQLVALYMLVANLIGQAGGPWFVAMVTDRVHGDPLAVGDSLSVVLGLVLTIGAAVIAFGLPALRALQQPDEEPIKPAADATTNVTAPREALR